ncbi:hypothetical protein [Terasakiella sp. SH-1]|uniref:hypothetical protein n=1 Tax=Terasakiella sp. SH-1 TaxID=2560057 RepID=UPI00107347EA|nr:hypothetical protein [Terasakiella sp. SH-1]
MLGGTLPFGAEQRLLPEWIPLTFFAFALICLPLGWLLVIIQAEHINSFNGGFGPALACLHMFTIGVILSAAFGASMQMLPVATGAVMNRPHLVVAVLCLLVIGTTITLGGFAHYLDSTATFGSFFLLVGISLYIFLLFCLLLRSETLKSVRNHVLVAAVALFLAAGLGFITVLNWAGYLPFYMENAAVMHMGLALYGFMGLLVLGFSRVMIPMLSLSDQTNDKICLIALISALSGLLTWSVGLYKIAPVLALLAACLHVYEMYHILKGRLRTRLGPEWHAIRFSWGMLPLSLVCATLSLWGIWPEKMAQFAVSLAVLGWLISFIIGILQRIVPFLLSMQIARKTGMPELPEKLAHQQLVKFIAPCHFIAVACVALALLFDISHLFRLAGLFGLISGICFLSYLLIAIRRKSASLEKMTS